MAEKGEILSDRLFPHRFPPHHPPHTHKHTDPESGRYGADGTLAGEQLVGNVLDDPQFLAVSQLRTAHRVANGASYHEEGIFTIPTQLLLQVRSIFSF